MTSIPPAAGRPASRERGCFVPLLFLLLFLAGSGIFWRFFLEPIAMLISSQRWQPTPCKIYYPDTERDDSGEKRAAGDRLRYRYTFNGEPYKSARIWFFKPDAGELDAIRRRYPPGDAVCYANPRRPEVATLERDFRPQFLIALFPITLAMIGLVGLLMQFHRRPARSFVEAYARQQREATIGPDGRVVRRKGRGLAVFLLSTIFAIAYNGVVYFLVRELVDTWSEGLPGCHGLFLTGFAVPFIAIGIAAIVLAVYLLLKLFNPRPTLTVSSANVPLGSSLEISWHFAGRIRRIRRVRIVVEGREEATYTRGAKIYTDREVFTSIELINSRDTSIIPHGHVTFTMPPSAAPSFRSANNSVSWAVRIHGHVRRWPDVETEVQLNIIPAGRIAEVPA